jgi:DNA-binding phage protein
MRRLKRTHRKVSAAERARLEAMHVQLEAERPEIEAEARAVFDRMEAIEHVVRELKAARIRKGISLSQVEAASGLGRSAVCRLENAADPNPTLETLLTYAQAIGVELRVAVLDKSQHKRDKASRAA